MRDRDCVEFLEWALPRLKLRWPGFRRVRNQVCKRIQRRLAELRIGRLEAYRRHLEDHPEEWQRLDFLCRVTVSRFYRHRGTFQELEAEVLPRLATGAHRRGSAALRVWSAGCASGEEPYSLKILWELRLADRFPDLVLGILATDFDPHLLERAEEACYPEGSLRELPGPWRQEAFRREGDLWCLRRPFRNGVRFLLMDLREETPSGPFDLILCRNLAFTYFDGELQGKIARRIAGILGPGGFLALGSHEELPPGVPGLTAWEGGRSLYRAS